MTEKKRESEITCPIDILKEKKAK